MLDARVLGQLMERLDAQQWQLERLGVGGSPRIMYARGYQNADQSIANGTPTLLGWNSARVFGLGIQDTANNRFVAQAPGWWFGCVHVTYATNGSNDRYVSVVHHTAGGGTATVIASVVVRASANGPTTLAVPFGWLCNTGDYFDVVTYQDSGGALNVTSSSASSPELWIMFVG